MRGDELRDLVAMLRDRQVFGKARRRKRREQLPAALGLCGLAAQG
jgi:hypothetical protein